MIHFIEAPIHFLENLGVNVKWLLIVVGFGLVYIIFTLFDFKSNQIIEVLLASAPLWLPVVTFVLFFDQWLEYVRKEFDLNQGRVTLEIKLPQDIFKSPEAMELVLTQLHQSASPDNHIQTYFDGKHPPRYGLEIISRGGDVRFYLSVPRKKFKNIAETQLYSQYPGIEVHELDIDYTAEIPWDKSRFSYFSMHFSPKKEDAYPIKTYIEYELHKMPKEEEKIDPITSMLEMLGSMGPGEYVWIQILIDANRKTSFKEGSLKTHQDWTDDARTEIKKIIENAAKRVGVSSDGIGTNVNQLLTDAEKDTIKAIERSLGKNAFNTTIRAMYIAQKDAFAPGEKIGAIITGWRAYDDLNRNAIGVRWRTDFDWNWWQDPHGHHADMLKKQELDEYKRRVYTSQSSKDGEKVFTTEELATIFHFPGKVAFTPSLARIPSKRAEPPSNLPIG
ncbi:MAG: hypothetical protein K9M10_01060 [Candidatus Pacebacteria bacterium]|nr:hypothetical protein [Candidatus Paceibacterota bacterium]MCF7857052.1 hypothetical protein [Candidatus Paceibacterota bacterium]